MKSRVIGAVLVLLILGGLFVLTEGEIGNSTSSPEVSVPNTNDSAFKDLKIN